jgi:hypothetical protein
MAGMTDNGQLERVAAMEQVRRAATAGSELITLWPLSTAQQLKNDVKYTENLQVRITWAAARVLTGQDVTLADAEFVYEGATDIPGRPQEVVDALLAVNDAYERMEGYSQTGDIGLVMAANDDLGADWGENTSQSVRAALKRIEACVPDRENAQSADAEAVARRFAFVASAVAELVGDIMDGDSPQVAQATVLMLYLNELSERMTVPRVALTDTEFAQIVDECAQTDGPEPRAEAVARMLAPLAQAEWTRHHDEIVFDPVAAKKAATEKEEQRKKAALAKKFKDVPEDKDKPPVEL